jgi:hypothetical protein
MPNDDAIRACSAVDHVESANMKLYVVTATGALLHKTGLRAQIAVLEAMNKNLTYKSLGNAITDKLIALRKELEG